MHLRYILLLKLSLDSQPSISKISENKEYPSYSFNRCEPFESVSVLEIGLTVGRGLKKFLFRENVKELYLMEFEFIWD